MVIFTSNNWIVDIKNRHFNYWQFNYWYQEWYFY